MLKWPYKNNKDKNGRYDGVSNQFKPAVLASVIASILSAQVIAQEEIAEEEIRDGAGFEEEVLVISPARKALQDALTLKREASNITDVLASGDIGEIPSLSVAEALEAIPGATTHRLKGSGSQVSLRGLGPVLGFSTFNGRAISAGAEGRNVNFQQFPAELMDKIIIHKSQEADMVEGGTSGTVELKTVKPLEYGKQAFVVDVRGKYNSHAGRVDGNNGLGSRGAFSYIDQFDVGEGRLGISGGLAWFDSGNPEESYITSSNFNLCEFNDRTDANTSRCSGFRQAADYYDNLYRDQQDFIAANGSLDGYQTEDLYIVPNSIGFRTLDEEEQRWAFMGAVQWQPNEQWEFNLDLQISNKVYNEERLELQVDDFRRGHRNVNINQDGTINSLDGSSWLRLDGNNFERDEDYQGGGLAVTFTPTEKLTLDLDISYSGTVRTQDQRYARFRASEEINFQYRDNGLVPSITLLDWTSDSDNEVFAQGDAFDANNSLSFDRDSDSRLRSRELERETEIAAIRFDVDYEFDDSFITSVEAGFRYSDLHRVTDQDDDLQTRLDVAYEAATGESLSTEEIRTQIFNSCSRSFRNDDFFGSANGTNIGTTFVDFDTACAISVGQGGRSGIPPRSQVPFQFNDIDVHEIVTAAYVKANFVTDIGIPVYGNFGVRAVQKKIESFGRLGNLVIEQDPDNATEPFRVISEGVANFREFTVTNTETEFLPSASAIFAINDDIQVRAAIARSLSRHSIDFFSAGINFTEDDQTFATREEAVGNVNTLSVGNPFLKPILTWNYDLSFEWYFNEESTVSVALYSKDFESELQNVTSNAEFGIEGFGNANLTQLRREESGRAANLWGIELNAQTVFTQLPGVFSGIGTRFTYNYSQTNFVTQDPRFGNTVRQAAGTPDNPESIFIPDNNGIVNLVQDTTGARYDIPGVTEAGLLQLDEASFFGQSDHVASLTMFWDIGPVNLQVINKYRSDYYQPNFGDERSNRWISAFHIIDLAASWKVNKKVKVRATVQNINDEPQTGHRTQRSNSLTLWSSTGPKYELGVTMKF